MGWLYLNLPLAGAGEKVGLESAPFNPSPPPLYIKNKSRLGFPNLIIFLNKYLAARYSGPALWTGFQGFWSYALPWPGEEGKKEEEAEGAVRWEEGLGGNFLSLLWRDLKTYWARN